MRALGYVHAQERYFEMDLLRRSAAGELAELFGAGRDRHRQGAPRASHARARRRATSTRSLGDKRAAGCRPTSTASMPACAASSVRPWPYLLLRTQPEPWRLADSALTGYAMYFDLQDAEQLARTRAVEDRAAPAAGAVRAAGPRRHQLGRAADRRAARQRRTARRADASTCASCRCRAGGRAGRRAGARRTSGSNNFAVAGAAHRRRPRDRRQRHAPGPARAEHLVPRAAALSRCARAAAAASTSPASPCPACRRGRRQQRPRRLGLHQQLRRLARLVRQRLRDATAPCACARARAPSSSASASRARTTSSSPVDETHWGPILHATTDGSALALRWIAHLPGALNLGLARLACTRDARRRAADRRPHGIPAQNLLIADRQRPHRLAPARADAACATAGCDAAAADRSEPVALRAAGRSRTGAGHRAGRPARVQPPVDRPTRASSTATLLARVGDGG